MTLQEEFQKQVQTLIDKDYPEMAQQSVEEFIHRAQQLEKHLPEVADTSIDLENGHLPFVIVIKNTLVPTEEAMKVVTKDGHNGVTKLFPHTSENFSTVSDITVPPTDMYLLTGIERGKDSLNIAPSDALTRITTRNRTPLTIDEGVAIVTHYPEFLIKNNCFSLLASRTGKDKRVPAIWINGSKQPNLGWCWNGNPHTWLGSASAAARY